MAFLCPRTSSHCQSFTLSYQCPPAHDDMLTNVTQPSALVPCHPQGPCCHDGLSARLIEQAGKSWIFSTESRRSRSQIKHVQDLLPLPGLDFRFFETLDASQDLICQFITKERE